MIDRIERRLSRRMYARVEAYLFTGHTTYVGFIENFCENGIEISVDTSGDSPAGLYAGEKVKIYFQLPTGAPLNLSCRLKWVSKSPDGETLSAGMNITNQTPEFRTLLKTLEIVSVN